MRLNQYWTIEKNLTKNFKVSEFACNDLAKTNVPPEFLGNALYVATQLQKIRDLLETPIIINSAYRTPNHNKQIGGQKNSNHLYAMAVDIRQSKMTNFLFYEKILELVKYGFIPNGEIIKYDTFVHYAPNHELKHYSKNETK